MFPELLPPILSATAPVSSSILNELYGAIDVTTPTIIASSGFVSGNDAIVIAPSTTGKPKFVVSSSSSSHLAYKVNSCVIAVRSVAASVYSAAKNQPSKVNPSLVGSLGKSNESFGSKNKAASSIS